MYLRALSQGLLKVFSLPRLSIPIILTLSLTLGAVLTVVAMVSNLMLKPLPDIKDEASLYTLNYHYRVSDKVSIPAFNKNILVALAQYYEQLGEISSLNVTDKEAEIAGQGFAVELFDAATNVPSNVMKQSLLLGEMPNQGNYQDKVWISEQLWLAGYNRSPNVIGQPIVLEGKTKLIQGVLTNFESYKRSGDFNRQQVWQFYSYQDLLQQPEPNHFMPLNMILFRVKQRKLTEQDIEDFLAQYFESHPEQQNMQQMFSMLKPKFSFESYRASISNGEQVVLWSLLATVTVLLAMACLNLLNLYLAHYQQRRSEWATHISLGASLTKVKRLIFWENYPAVLLASIFGLLAAAWLIRYLPFIFAGNISLLGLVELDVFTLMYALFTSFVINFIFTSIATKPFSAQGLLNGLGSSNKGVADKSATGISKLLFVLQISFAVLILSCCAMLAKVSYQHLNRDMGYQAGNTLMAQITLESERIEQEVTTEQENLTEQELKLFMSLRQSRQRHHLLQQAMSKYDDQIRVLDSPTDPFGMSFQRIQIETLQDGSSLSFATPTIAPDFVDAFNIALLEGRNLTQQEYEQGLPVALVNQALAEIIKQDQNLDSVIGHYFHDKEIIGVLSNTYSFLSSEDTIMPQLLSAEHAFKDQFLLLMQADEDYVFDRMEIQRVLTEALNSVKTVKLKTIEEQQNEAQQDKKVQYYFILMLSALTLMLAVLGGVGMARTFAEMKRFEVAIRMSTGATRAKLLWQTLSSFRNLALSAVTLAIIFSSCCYLMVRTKVDFLPEFSWSATLMFLSLLLSLVFISIVLVIWKMLNQDPMKVLREE